MGVRPAETERIDPCIAQLARRGDWLRVTYQTKIQCVEGDVRVGRLAMQRRWNHTPVEGERRLQQTGHSRCRFQMTDIGLYRSDRERVGPALAEGVADGGGFDRISRRRSGAVHFEEGQIFWSNARTRIDRTQQGRLCRLARQRQSDRSAVGIDPSAENYGADRVAIGERIIEGSQDYHRAALSPDVAIGAFVECKAPSAPRKHRGGAKPEIRVGGEQEVDAADN